ncbi:lactadherin-like [Diadema setosum]|uniref:lactadherin-like n=1 Tax=Diadema setosum TaxID=31175 RepID=UPI003B3B1ADF
MVLGQGLEKITCGKKWDRRSGSFVQQELVSVPPASKLAMMMSQWAPHISTVSSCIDPGETTTQETTTTDTSPTTGSIPTTTVTDSVIPRDAVPLGLQSCAIPDTSLSASTKYGHHESHGPGRGRLHLTHVPGDIYLAGAWCAAQRGLPNQWFQVDLQSPHRIVGIATQGRSEFDQWVTSYKVMCSADGTTFNPVEEICNTSGNDTTFQGNMDRNTVVYNALPRPQNCQSVRVAPLTYHHHTCMRLEVYEQTPGVPDDVVPLGMESGEIPDSSLEVFGSTGLSAKSWRLNRNNVYPPLPGGYQWIQVDLQTQLEVVGIATQGSYSNSESSWVMSYKVSYGTDRVNVTVVQESCGDMIFTANWDNQTVVFNRIPNPLYCRYVRLEPISWNTQTNTVFRLELYGSST